MLTNKLWNVTIISMTFYDFLEFNRLRSLEYFQDCGNHEYAIQLKCQVHMLNMVCVQSLLSRVTHLGCVCHSWGPTSSPALKWRTEATIIIINNIFKDTTQIFISIIIFITKDLCTICNITQPLHCRWCRIHKTDQHTHKYQTAKSNKIPICQWNVLIVSGSLYNFEEGH